MNGDSHPFAERTVGITALRAVAAETAVAQKGELCLADPLACQDAGKYDVQYRDPMIEAACRHTEEGYVAQVGYEEHGAGQGCSPIVEFSCPGLANAVHRSGAANRSPVLCGSG